MRAAVRLAMLVAAAAVPQPAWSWGFVAHRIVAESAAAAMPPGIASFYTETASRISDASIEPDSILRARDGEREKRNHYIDLDELDRPPFAKIPHDETDARRVLGDRRVEGAGRLPWRILDLRDRLVEAFRRGDRAEAATLSGWLSHYVADAYQPLHTTRNHDDQRTGNRGIHAAFETDLIDLGKGRYRRDAALPDAFVPDPIPDPREFIFAEITNSYGLVREILAADGKAMIAVKTRRADYFEQLERRAGPIARRQLSSAAAAVARVWHSAWIEAGSPSLTVEALREARP